MRYDIYIVNLGTYSFKTGFSSSNKPKESQFPFLSRDHLNDNLYKNKICYNDIQNYINFPYKNGIVNDFDDLDTILDCLFSKINCISTCLFIVTPNINRTIKERFTILAFEKYNFMSLAILDEYFLCAYASELYSGIICDIGYEETRLIPIINYSIQDVLIRKIPIGGNHITNYIYYNLYNNNRIYSGDFTIKSANEIKENLCYFKDHFKSNMPEENNIYTFNYNKNGNNIIKTVEELYMGPEILFDPSIINLDCYGLHSEIYEVISRYSQYTHHKNAKIILNGGTTCIKGLKNKIHARMGNDITRPYIIIDQEEKKYLGWHGAKKLTNKFYFDQFLIYKDEYGDYGCDKLFEKSPKF